MDKNILIIITLGLVIGLGLFLLGGQRKNNINTKTGNSSQNVEIKDGIQYVTVEARGGYSPRVSNAKANIPTKLIIKTDGTYDCSASLAIRSLNFQKILTQTGEEVIDLGTPKVGQKPIQGTCSMGMYSFTVNFI